MKMPHGVVTESIACGVDARHCRVSVNADMDDMLMQRWTGGKRVKPPPAQERDLSQMRVHRTCANSVHNKTALMALHGYSWHSTSAALQRVA